MVGEGEEKKEIRRKKYNHLLGRMHACETVVDADDDDNTGLLTVLFFLCCLK